MTSRQIGNNHGIVVPGGTQQNGGASPTAGYIHTDMNNVATMKAKLAALAAGTYTAAKLSTMTANDCVFALRKLDPTDTL